MLEMGRIVPVYESLGGTTPWGAKLTSKWMRRVVWSIFEELDKSMRVPQVSILRPGFQRRSPPQSSNASACPPASKPFAQSTSPKPARRWWN